MSTQRFIVENHGPNISTVQKLFEQSAAFCLRNRIGQLSLVTPDLDTFPDTVIAEYLGRTVTRGLCRGRPVTLVKGLDLRLLAPEQLLKDGDNGLVLAAFLSLEALGNIDNSPLLTALAFLPWAQTDGQRWMGVWSPAVWGESLNRPRCA
ncbi:hypothetical protein [Pseudomonas sp. dw_358]|uniref:hypothetical protein n=1 Tax=Pseudomonas sp. dw_358 TaxID=2720083 RepID=UPI001BD2A057|nr:hypothetical protein [Pseudomonas sp. dw_358]